ncbi:MAG TPA: ATP-binding protein [Anaerolineae bacterium]|nr:ATP-binding protein [Anaerolineae bacterium]
MGSLLWQLLSEVAVRAHDAPIEEAVYGIVGDGLKTSNLRATIALYDEMLERFRVVYVSTARPILIAAEKLFGARSIGYEIPLAESFTLGEAVRSKAAVYRREHLPYPSAPEPRLRTLKRGIDLLGSSPHIAAPLLARDRVLGAIAVESKHLTEDDAPAVMVLARQVAQAIDNLRRGREAAGRERQMAIIMQINQAVSADLDVGRAYEVALQETHRLVSFDAADLALIDPGVVQVRIVSPQPDAGEAASYPLAGSVVEWVAARNQAYHCTDTHREAEFSEARAAALKRLRSFVALPLRHRGQVHGAFIVKSHTPYAFGDSDSTLLAPIVDQLAITLANYRLLDQVERGRRQLRAVLDSTGDAVIAVDAAGGLTLINPAAERLFEVSAAQLTGKPVWEAIAFEALTDVFRQALAGKFETQAGFELPFEAKRTLFADLAPIRDVSAGARGWMAVVRDITHEKQRDALRSEAVAMAAHDLKSPLHLASGALGMLAEDALTMSEDQLEALNIAQTGLRRMRILIDDLLDLKKIEDGFGIVKRECQLDAVLRSVVDEARAAAEERGQQLDVQIVGALPLIQADPDRLHQAFDNLVGNAIKYTQPGGEVSVRAAAAGAQARVEVIDNGPGLSAEEQAHIFQKFYRAQTAVSTEGTGLGLAIVKSIIEQHGGQVVVHSAPGRGSRFVVTLPVPGAERPP